MPANQNGSNPKLNKSVSAKPFLKWAGGKTQLLTQYSDYYPTGLESGELNRYVEPFVGGGALFLEMVNRFPIAEAVLFDINVELVLAYRVVQLAPEELIQRLAILSDSYFGTKESGREKFYYQVREAYNIQRLLTDYEDFSAEWITRAAYMIFLNKTCFNGLYRVNASGEFNVPFGRYKRPPILDAQNIRLVSAALQIAEVRAATFEETKQHIDDRTFVYFDPPYRPISPTSSFTSYSRHKFDDDAQIQLAQYYTELDQSCGAKLMLSNSDPKNYDPSDDFFELLYQGHKIHRVQANRMINSKGEKRGKISELLITNY